VKLHDMLMGGGFGRRGNRDVDFIIDAVLLSKEAGRPVKVMWTREDDVHNGRFRPISAHYLKAGFDRPASSRPGITASPSTASGPTWIRCATRWPAARTSFAMLGADLKGYDVPHQLVEQLYRDTGVRTNPLRGISFLANRFATEAFIDEIARKRGVDPSLTARTPQGHPARIKVVERVAQMADWGKNATAARSASPISTIPAHRWPASPRCRSTARSGRSRCITSGAPSTAAWRCSPTTWWRRPRAASSTGSA
jgi:isoquinoline 1-oxidoreductase beta subunit